MYPDPIILKTQYIQINKLLPGIPYSMYVLEVTDHQFVC